MRIRVCVNLFTIRSPIFVVVEKQKTINNSVNKDIY